MFLLGLVVGSFVNVLIFRIPRKENFIRGRSRCYSCGHVLGWKDLIPLVSFIFLQGRCRYCSKKISCRYPIVELYSGLIFFFSFVIFHQNGLGEWLFILFLAEFFLIIFWIDLNHLIIPDNLLVTAFLVTIIYGFLGKIHVFDYHFQIFSLGNILAGITFFTVLFFVWLLSHGTWLGLGDAKLLGIIGLSLGLVAGLNIFYGAIIMGAVVGALILLTKQGTLKTKLPLATFLSLAATFYLFTGFVIIKKNMLLFILRIFK